MYLKIYFGSKPLFLCDQITPEIEPYVHHDDAVLIDEFSAHIGGSTQVWNIRIVDEQQKLVCISRITVAILKKK